MAAAPQFDHYQQDARLSDARPSETGLLDIDHFRHMTGDDADLQAEIANLFRAQAEIWARLLNVDAPIQTWTDAAHTLKGSARGIGLWTLADACEVAEAVGKADSYNRAAAAAALAEVRAALVTALRALAAH